MSALRQLRRLRQDDSGTTLVELALVISVFLLIFFTLIDFGRLAHHTVMAEKAMQMAARMAAVRPAVCLNVPQTNQRAARSTAYFGTMCSAASGPCAAVATATCSGSSANAVANAIFESVRPLLPLDATPANLKFSYSNDPAMNFLGGPYVPVVTVELQNLQFQFTSPLLGLARLAGANTTGDAPGPLTFPSMSVSLPGEDLALGDAG